MFDQFTLGIEEEFQIVDPRTRELRSHVVEILEEGVAARGTNKAGDDPVDGRSGHWYLPQHPGSPCRYYESPQRYLESGKKERPGNHRSFYTSHLALARSKDF